jgi:small-conductance mechanosensitive channel
MWRGLLASLPQIFIGIAILVATWLVTRLLDRLLKPVFHRLHLRDSLIELFRKLAIGFIWIIGLLIAGIVVIPGFEVSSVLAALGLGSVAIGFAFKDIFENFLAGILILLREPFRLGDFIECNGLEGHVETITIRDTHIRQVDGQRVVVPNAILFKDPVTVRTDLPLRRITVICGVAYGEDVDRSRKVIHDTVKDLPSVNKEKPVQIFAQEFADSSINFEVTWWTGSEPVDIRRSRDEVVAAVKRALDKAGIEIPFPYRTLTFKEPLSVMNGENARRE